MRQKEGHKEEIRPKFLPQGWEFRKSMHREPKNTRSLMAKEGD